MHVVVCMQLVAEAHEAKHSLMQSQDCIRLMATSAAASEARAIQLQDQLKLVGTSSAVKPPNFAV